MDWLAELAIEVKKEAKAKAGNRTWWEKQKEMKAQTRLEKLTMKQRVQRAKEKYRSFKD